VGWGGFFVDCGGGGGFGGGWWGGVFCLRRGRMYRRVAKGSQNWLERQRLRREGTGDGAASTPKTGN